MLELVNRKSRIRFPVATQTGSWHLERPVTSYPAHPRSEKCYAKAHNRRKSCRRNARDYHYPYPSPTQAAILPSAADYQPGKVLGPGPGPSLASSRGRVPIVSFSQQAGGASLRAQQLPPELTCPWLQLSPLRTL